MVDVERILKTPGVCGGKPRINGRRITVQIIAQYYVHGKRSIDEIVEAFNLSEADVFAALNYYYEHREEIEAAIREDEAKAEDLPSILDMIDDTLFQVMTPKEIAEEYPVTTSAVYQAIRRGQVPARKSGGTWLLLREDVSNMWGAKLRTRQAAP
jgi:excisionase family DNA binding protein